MEEKKNDFFSEYEPFNYMIQANSESLSAHAGAHFRFRKSYNMFSSKGISYCYFLADHTLCYRYRIFKVNTCDLRAALTIKKCCCIVPKYSREILRNYGLLVLAMAVGER